MPYITSEIIIQLLIVVVPKFEQWRDEGAVGQKKLTQTARYLTIALALMQSTGLAFVFHNGGGGFLGGGHGLNIDLIPKFTVAAGPADRADHDGGHGRSSCGSASSSPSAASARACPS